jgi:hypothetical protein
MRIAALSWVDPTMRPLLLLALVACASNPNDVTGTVTGPVTRYAIDKFTLPTTSSLSLALGDSLDGDVQVDNAFGDMVAVLFTYGDLNAHAADMLAAGSIASSIELQANNLTTSSKAGATYFGADGDDATQMLGKIAGSAFTSNRTSTMHVLGTASVTLPMFQDADPATFELDAMELDLTPDGLGGYDTLVRGGATLDHVLPALCSGITQMLANNPHDHAALLSFVDTNHDGDITCYEVQHSQLIAGFLEPDVTLQGDKMLSFGFGAHLVPCDSGTCNTAAPADTCNDRARDGDETDVDCGGSTCTRRCLAGATCSLPSDCASNACDAGHCRVSTCGDGVQDGFETDVDCGWNCNPCGLHQGCYEDRDCTAGYTCLGGTCGPAS